LSEKAGLRRKSPRTKTTLAETVRAIISVLVRTVINLVCGSKIVEVVAMTAAIGTAINQPCLSWMIMA